MAESEEICLMNLGKRCSYAECRRQDFLPFQCEKCKQDFCQHHQSPSSHQCINANLGNVVIPTCPLCNQPIDLRRSRGKSIDAQVERHILSGCTEQVLPLPSEAAGRRRASRCAYRHCRAVPLVPFWCSDCQRNFCVRHRSAYDHSCAPVPVVPPVTCH